MPDSLQKSSSSQQVPLWIFKEEAKSQLSKWVYSPCFQVQEQVNVTSDLDLCFHLSPISTLTNKLCCLELITSIWASFVRKNVGSPEVWWDSWRASVTLAVNQGCITILLSPPGIEIMVKLLLGLGLYFVLVPFHPPCNSLSTACFRVGTCAPSTSEVSSCLSYPLNVS